ncbi:MAG: hypothetical protein AB3N11_04320 [Arenibacterium sp.]
MIASPLRGPVARSVLPTERLAAMKVILHVGAHRCATTTFQHYMRRQSSALRQGGVGFWGPGRTRTGLFSGIQPRVVRLSRHQPARRAAGRLRLNMTRSAQKGIDTLVVSDENMLGSMFANAEAACLYPAAGERLARYGNAFGQTVSDVILSVRAQDRYWASLLGYLAAKGYGPWPQEQLQEIVDSHRSWRDVLMDIACAVPNARVHVAPFEIFASRPDALLRAVVPGSATPRSGLSEKRNATPKAAALRILANEQLAPQLPDELRRWSPFSKAACAALKEAYADDIQWLRGGADGLARLVSDPDKTQPDKAPDHTNATRGNGDDRKENRMAATRRNRIARQASRDPYLENARRY